MKEWYSASELVGLSGMPSIRENVARKARIENWHFRRRNGRGGGREYAFASLPEATRNALSTSNINQTDNNLKPEVDLAPKAVWADQARGKSFAILAHSIISAPTEGTTARIANYSLKNSNESVNVKTPKRKNE